MRILIWHVHGAWTTAFVQGDHDYVVPVNASRDTWGLGRARTYPWPDSVIERASHELHHEDIDVVVLQRPEEIDLCAQWLGRRPGRDVPAVYVEHNTPRGDVSEMQHPIANRDDVLLVHVTHFNQVYWDAGRAPTTVIEHGVPDPGHRYTGELSAIGVAVNEPVRRGRVTGTDLLPQFSRIAPLQVFGMKVSGLAGDLGLAPDRLIEYEDLPQTEMHDRLAECRAYLHPMRWTSLGLSLLEAMHLGLPVVVLAGTEAIEAVPAGAGVVSTSLDVIADALRDLLHDPAYAAELGRRGRQAALSRYGLPRFLSDWDQLLKEVAR